MFLTTKTIEEELIMTQLQFTLDFDEIKEKVINSSLDEILKSTIVLVLNEFMEKERDDYLNVKPYERSGDRHDSRNGYYDRELLMNIGNINLRVPRTRSGEFVTSVFEKYQRSDQGFLLAMVEMVVNGVSTRKVKNVVEQLCGESVSKSFVSSLSKKLEPEVKEWAERSLNNEYFPYILSMPCISRSGSIIRLSPKPSISLQPLPKTASVKSLVSMLIMKNVMIPGETF